MQTHNQPDRAASFTISSDNGPSVRGGGSGHFSGPQTGVCVSQALIRGAESRNLDAETTENKNGLSASLKERESCFMANSFTFNSFA